MLRATKFGLLATASVFALAACEPTTNYNPNDPNQRTREGAMIGAGAGVLTGLLTGDNAKERRNRAIGGAIIGGVVGGAIGNSLDRQAADLRNSMDDRIGIVNTGDELIVTMPQDILFAVDSAALRPDLRSDLRALANNLQDYPDTTVDVVGHTDSTGERSYNQQLSSRRAESVADVLINAGVRGSRIRAYGRGEDEPIASNATVSGRTQNRRVEIIIRPIR